ncbi:translation initiation factor IF-2 isoform X2 [Plutella xylostella]|uniref:translation initiation factor IF-2 isoform X2 n=1 Tax=Plutella xylostella TaxID=51655 RepID=UPI002033096D|nr:translation initiation factor IF-2 isoform X2 [Plutella xylostella]
MGLFILLTPILTAWLISVTSAAETLPSALTPAALAPAAETKDEQLQRQIRQSYYDYYPYPGYAPAPAPRPLYERLAYPPARCGRCLEDRYERRRNRDRYDDDEDDDDDRRSHRPTSGSRHDKNRSGERDRDDDDDRRYNSDRRNGDKNNGTSEEGDDSKDDKDDKKGHGSRHRDRDRDRDHRNRYDDRDRYRPDYYDRFLRDPYRERVPYGYEDPYRRPLYDRGYPEDRFAYPSYRRPVYDDRYDRGGAYDDGYGGYAPGVGRGPHDRPWDETYRGQAGWDAGGRGYYFASGRPEPAAPAWGAARVWDEELEYDGRGYPAYQGRRWAREYYRPEQSPGYQSAYPSTSYQQSGAYPSTGQSGYQSPGYQSAYPSTGYQSAYPSTGYRQQAYQGSFGQESGYRPSGWHSVGERRPYRDQSGVNKLDSRDNYGQGYQRPGQNAYGQSSAYGQSDSNRGSYAQTDSRRPADAYDQNVRGQAISYGSDAYGSSGSRGQGSYGQNDGYSASGSRGQGAYGQNDAYGSTGSRGQGAYGQNSDAYGSSGSRGQGYDQNSSYGGNRQSSTYGQVTSASNSYAQSTTTPGTSYLYQRADEQVTVKEADEETTKTPSS